jgi:hypothetical protein
MRHANGRGHVDDQAEARPLAFVDAASHVKDYARVHSGRLVSTTVALQTRFSNAHATRSVIACDEVTGGRLVECGLFDQSCVWDAPTLFRVTAREGARVYGNAIMLGPLELLSDMRVLAGTWHRAPRFCHLGYCFLTEGPPGWAMIDCKFNSYAGWFRVGPRYARRWWGWTHEMHDRVRDVLIVWSETEDFRGKHWGSCVAGCYGRGPS